MWIRIGCFFAGMLWCISGASAQLNVPTDKLRRDLAQLMREGSPTSCFADIEVINRAKEQSGGERPEGTTSLVLYDVRFLKVRPTSKTKPGA